MALNIFQQVFCLSMEICSASQATGTVPSLEAQLTANFNNLFANANFGSGWRLVWGPAVWQSSYSNVVDQATAVCYNRAENYYVVPIAATSPLSPFMVLIEDLAVVPPSYMRSNPSTGAGNLSYGNYVALEALINLTSKGQTLGQYLAGAASSADSVVFCGHSLGGGLTPLLAYALYPQGTANSGWQNVYTYPTAGPTTADATFHAVFNKAYPVTQGSGYAMWNANQYNGRDVVPHAWSISSGGPNLNQITASYWDNSGMFRTGLQVLTEISVLQAVAVNYANGGGGSNPYIQSNNNLLWTAAQQTVPLNTNADLESEILYQHVTAYIDEFGVGSVIPAQAARRNIVPPLLPLVRAVAGTGVKLAVAQA
jgi:hypothetical protein